MAARLFPESQLGLLVAAGAIAGGRIRTARLEKLAGQELSKLELTQFDSNRSLDLQDRPAET